jgi:hypothetical protein
MSELKKHGINISLSTVATLVPVLTVVWFIVQPALISSVSTAVAADLDEQITNKQAPVQSAFKVLLKTEIAKLRKEIARLEHYKDDSGWTEDDAEYLAELKIELDALKEAYQEL